MVHKYNFLLNFWIKPLLSLLFSLEVLIRCNRCHCLDFHLAWAGFPFWDDVVLHGIIWLWRGQLTWGVLSGSVVVKTLFVIALRGLGFRSRFGMLHIYRGVLHLFSSSAIRGFSSFLSLPSHRAVTSRWRHFIAKLISQPTSTQAGAQYSWESGFYLKWLAPIYCCRFTSTHQSIVLLMMPWRSLVFIKIKLTNSLWVIVSFCRNHVQKYK